MREKRSDWRVIRIERGRKNVMDRVRLTKVRDVAVEMVMIWEWTKGSISRWTCSPAVPDTYRIASPSLPRSLILILTLGLIVWI